MAEIRSATVGGVSAGGILLPEPEGPWHFTWPDVVSKTLDDVLKAYQTRRGHPDGEDEGDDEYPTVTPTPSTPRIPAVPTSAPVQFAGISLSPWLLLGIVGLIAFKLWR